MRIDPQLLIRLFGAAFVGLGIAARSGWWKDWYWHGRSSAYSYVPLGLLCLLYSLDEMFIARLGVQRWLVQGIYGGLIIVGFWWLARPPTWIQPTWVRWVEGCPEEAQHAMAAAVERKVEWKSHMTNREQVEAWAKAMLATQSAGRSRKHKSRNGH